MIGSGTPTVVLFTASNSIHITCPRLYSKLHSQPPLSIYKGVSVQDMRIY